MSAFFRCFLPNREADIKLRIEPLISSTGVNCSAFVNTDRVQVLFTCTRD